MVIHYILMIGILHWYMFRYSTIVTSGNKDVSLSHFFIHTVKPDDDQPIVLITAPQDQQHSKLVGLQSILYFDYIIIINPNQVGGREVKCNWN